MSDATYIQCPICKGTGHDPADDDGLTECGECHGTGEVCSQCGAHPPTPIDGVIVGGCWHAY